MNKHKLINGDIITEADIDAFAKLLGFSVKVKRSPNSSNWVYTIVHEGEVRHHVDWNNNNWNNNNEAMAMERGTVHMHEYLIKRFKLGE